MVRDLFAKQSVVARCVGSNPIASSKGELILTGKEVVLNTTSSR